MPFAVVSLLPFGDPGTFAPSDMSCSSPLPAAERSLHPLFEGLPASPLCGPVSDFTQHVDDESVLPPVMIAPLEGSMDSLIIDIDISSSALPIRPSLEPAVVELFPP